MGSPVEDIAAIQTLKARYCAAVDRLPGDAQSVRAEADALFMPWVRADYGGALLDGVEALAGFLETAVAGNSEAMIHMIHTPLIEVTGDVASGEWTLLARMKRRGTGNLDMVYGRYVDEFQKTDRGWRISKIRFLRFE